MSRIIIDGYNAIFGCDRFESISDSEGLQAGREALCRYLAEECPGADTIVVFDGSPEAGFSVHERISSIRVEFSSRSYTADEMIEGMIQAEENPRRVTVVTSDGHLAAKVRALGARTIRVEEFLESMPAPEAEIELSEPDVKFKGPDSQEVDYWMKVFECDDEE